MSRRKLRSRGVGSRVAPRIPQIGTMTFGVLCCVCAFAAGRVEGQSSNIVISEKSPVPGALATSPTSGQEPAQGRKQKPTQQPTQRTVTLIVQDSTLTYVLDALAKQARRPVIFNNTNALFAKRVSVRIINQSLSNAIAIALRGTGLGMSTAPDGETIVVHEASDTSVQGQEKLSGSITGHVTDSATGKPISGVTVSLRGTTLSTLTAQRGTYSLSGVPVGSHVLTFRLVGYRSATQTVTVQVGKSNVANAALSPSTAMLTEVVTSVTGMQKKLEIGNDVTTINVDSVLRVAPIANMTDLLETRVPGLTVIRSSGVPGAPSRLRLRGLGGGLLSGQKGAPTNDPIVIVDGIRINASQSGITDQNLAMDRSVLAPGASPTYSSEFPPPSAIDQIDPNSVDKIEVLKGPSAAALYGSDAANGVIVITTKRGQAGPARWSVSANQDIEYLAGSYTAPGYYPFCHDFDDPFVGSPTICRLDQLTRTNVVIDSVVRFQALNESRLTPFGTGNGNGLSASISGGSQALTYSVTGSLTNKLGLLKVPSFYQDLFQTIYDSAMPKSLRRPNVMQTRSMSASLVTEPRRGMRAILSTRLTNSNQRQSSAQLQLAALASQYLDTMSVSPTSLESFATRVTANRFVIDNTLAVHWDRWQAFPFTTTIGFSRESRKDNRFVPYGIISELERNSRGFYSGGSAENNTRSGGINGTILPGRVVSAALGFDVTRASQQSFQGKSDSLRPGVVMPTLFTYAGQSSTRSATGGWFVEPRLNLNSRFFVNPGFRFDGSSLSGARGGAGGGLWSLFPKLNFSWIAIDREGGAPMWGAVSMLRPRLSFGVAGSPPAIGWQLRLMTPRVIQCGGNSGCPVRVYDYGLELSTLGNTQLHPERTREIEGGFDIDLWNGRMSVTATQFYKLRIDAIEQVPVASSVYGGLLNLYSNIGKVRNTGTEISVASTLIENSLVRWAVNASISMYENKLLTLNSDKNYLEYGDGTRLVPGYPLFGRWSRPLLGATPSSLIQGRLSPNDVIVGDSMVYVGQQAPNFELPFNTSVSLFQGLLNFHATFQYQDGLTQINRGSAQLVRNLYLNPAATVAEQAAALAADACKQINSPQCTDYGLIQTVNSLRFKSMSIGYAVPRQFAQRLGVPSITVSLTGKNLGLWTNYRGKDPNVNSGTVGDMTQDNGQLPQSRTWGLQVRVGN